MDKLEQYLDQVCRGIGESRSLRQHIRQELREHLLDAVAEYRAQGMTEEQAIARALEDFGGTEQVRQELEATHGHRAMAVVVDTAVQWKERTMKAKWLWISWAHVVLMAVITLQVLLITMAVIFILPRQMWFQQLGCFDGGGPEFDSFMSRAFGFLGLLLNAIRNWMVWVVPIVAAWVMFEWRCRSENKTLMRLSGMGVIALVLMVVIFLTATAMMVPMSVAVALGNARNPERIVLGQIDRIDASLVGLEQALVRNDREGANSQVINIHDAVDVLRDMGSAAPVLAALRQRQISDVRSEIRSASEVLPRGFQLGHAGPAGFKDAIERFKTAYAQFRPPTTQPSRREP